MPLYLGLVNPTNQAAVLAALIANVNPKGLTAGKSATVICCAP